MSDQVYDVLKDLVVPGLAGIGGILVGIGAIVVSGRSHDLAEKVRNDEQRRDEEAARARHRDRLFQTVEPTITAMLAHRAALQQGHLIGSETEIQRRSDSVARLRLVFAVAGDQEARLVSAVLHAQGEGVGSGREDVLSVVLGRLALTMSALVEEGRSFDRDLRELRTLLNETVERLDKASKSDAD